MLPDRVLKPLTFATCCAPLAWLGYRVATGTLGADPIALGLNALGWWALVMLLASLACTPLQLLFGWNWPIRIRRMVGLFAFTYASLHLCTYLGVDQGFDWRAIGEDILKRKFITIGMTAWALMVPLAITSTRKMLQWLRAARWKRLHRLAYVSATLGVFHFFLRVKADTTVPLRFAAVLALLLGVRIVWFLVARRRRRQPVQAF